MNWKGTLSTLAAVTLFGFAHAQSGMSKIEPDLRELANKSGSANVRVFVYLRRQHAAEAAEFLSPVYQPQIDRAAEAFKRVALASRGMTSQNHDAEVKSVNSGTTLFEMAALRPYSTEIDRLRTEYGDAVARNARANSVLDFALAKSFLESAGGRVVGDTVVVSAVIADVPANRLGDIAKSDSVASIGQEHPMQSELNNSAQAVLANSFWSNGATGGPADVGVLDTGVQHAHAAFTGFRWEAFSQTDSDGHGSHVCGIMCSNDATYRGMAWGADTVSVYPTTNESVSMTGLNWLMTNVVERAEDVNHSFGYGTANTTDYRNTDQFFDGACDNFSFLVSKSTGNNGYGTTTITHPAPAYNLIAVASMNDFNTPSRTDDRVSSFSSSGPTLGGRKKPDIAAPGENIMSVNRAGGFVSMSGTSMAAPHAGGSVILLMGLGAPSPMAAKAVLINSADAMNSNNTASTADDSYVANSRWDKAYGWGYINLANAYLHAPDVFERTLASPNGGQRQFKLFRGQVFTNEKTTLTWNRHVAFNGPNYPTIIRALSNLDLKAYDQSSGAQTAASASTIDNVEQLSAPADAMTVLKVSAEGNFDPNVATERYALATQEGFVEAAGPNLTGTWSKGLAAHYLSPFAYKLTLKNTGDVPAFNVTVLLSNVNIVSGSNPVNVGTILPGQSVVASWTVKRTSGVSFLPSAAVTSASYGENWAWAFQDPNPL